MDKENIDIIKKFFTELLGTFFLVFFACGTAIVSDGNIVATSLSFGLVLLVLIYSLGHISGCHLNPAVSLAMAINKKISWMDFMWYVIAQMFGALLGAIALYGILNLQGFELITNIDQNLLKESFGANYLPRVNGEVMFKNIVGALLFELIITYLFVYVVLSVTSKNRYNKVAGIVIGLALTLVHLIGIPLTGTSVNPARSFGPALAMIIFGGSTKGIMDLWLFILAPLCGGALAGIHHLLCKKENNLD